MSKISIIFWLALSATLLTSCKKTNEPPKPSEVEVVNSITLDKSNYQIGENLLLKTTGNLLIEDYVITSNDLDAVLILSNNNIIAKKEGDYYLILTNKVDSSDIYILDFTVKDKINFESIKVELDSYEYWVQDTLDFSASNYDLEELNFSFDDPIAFKANEDGTFTARRSGEYMVKVSLKVDPSISTSFSVTIYSISFDLSITSSIITLGDSVDVWIYSYEAMKESSVDDFIFSTLDNSIVSIDENHITSIGYGYATIIATSKFNPNVTRSIKVLVANKNTFTMLRFKESTKSICAGEVKEMELTGKAVLTDFNWISSNGNIVRVTKYDTKLEVTGISEGGSWISCVNKKDPTISYTYYITVKGSVEYDPITRLLNTAYGEVGVKETGNNVQKYGEWYGNNGQPWCATFVSWCFYHAGLSFDLMLKYQGCQAGMDWSISKGIFYYKEKYTPKSGDIVFFLSSGMSHTGIVAYADSTYIYTIEGNSSNKVGIWRWLQTDAHITGYASPKYSSPIKESYEWIATKNNNGVFLWTDHLTGTSVL